MTAKEAIIAAFDEAGINNPDFWEKHCKRYHPDGIGNGTECKYIKKAGKTRIDEEGKSGIAKNHYLGIMRQKSFPESIDILRDKYGVLCLDYDFLNDDKTLKSITSLQFREGWKWCAKKPSVHDYATICMAVRSVLDDIYTRFGSVPKFEFLAPAITTGTGVGGLSELDHIEVQKATLMISNTFSGISGFSFGYKDTILFDRIRHELGHLSTTKSVAEAYSKTIKDLARELGASVLLENLERWSSKYGVLRGGNEIIAEIYSRYTHPLYEKGYLHPKLEDFVRKNMIGGKK